MSEVVTSPLTAWESFYVIVGSSAAALTGLQFVVMALVAERERKSTVTEVDAFGTPTVVHFSAVLFVSAVLSAPWPTLTGADLVVGACGLAGVVYSLLVVRRARRQKGYQPVFEDWLFHAILPLLAYGTLLGAAIALVARTEAALFAIAAVALLLLSIGIHNSWDTVTYIVLDRSNSARKEPKPDSGERSAQ